MAVRFEVTANATITGVVTNANDGLPVEGASVVASPGGKNATTDAEGRYTLKVIDGSYEVTASVETIVIDAVGRSWPRRSGGARLHLRRRTDGGDP